MIAATIEEPTRRKRIEHEVAGIGERGAACAQILLPWKSNRPTMTSSRECLARQQRVGWCAGASLRCDHGFPAISLPPAARAGRWRR
jgi:hypothetical protein